METVNEKNTRYGRIVQEVLTKLASIPYLETGIRDRTLFDEPNHRYGLISEGWNRDERIHRVIADIEIINGKVWIQADNTDITIARRFEMHGIPKSDIVLSFRPPSEMGYATT